MVALYLRERGEHQVVDVGPRKMVFPDTRLCDISDKQAVLRLITEAEPAVVINCTGILVKASEDSKREAVLINAYLPHLLSEYCSKLSVRLIHLSTDCVFSGISGPYEEGALRDGDAFYDRSKALGELNGSRDLTIRTSIIGPEIRNDGTGLFDWAIRHRGEIRGFRRAMWSGVTTLELAKFIEYCINVNRGLSGIVHYSVAGGISKYGLLMAIAEVFGLDLLIQPAEEPVLDKRLTCTRGDLGIQPPTYPEQLKQLKAWILEHNMLYADYMGKR
jgi:dTDP-4-dehydrorhamnose reductase